MLFLDDWRSDQYRWSNQGVHLLPKNPTVRKSYFQIDTPEGPTDKFIKHAYQLVNATGFSKDAVLIHYLGDDSYAVDFPHGNSSGEAQRPHSRTCPSVMKSLKEGCKYSTTANVYRKHVTEVPPETHLAVLQPRNTRQVNYIKSMI